MTKPEFINNNLKWLLHVISWTAVGLVSLFYYVNYEMAQVTSNVEKNNEIRYEAIHKEIILLQDDLKQNQKDVNKRLDNLQSIIIQEIKNRNKK